MANAWKSLNRRVQDATASPKTRAALRAATVILLVALAYYAGLCYWVEQMHRPAIAADREAATTTPSATPRPRPPLDPDGAPVYPRDAKRQLIFCITPGHTGTLWLTEILGCAYDTLAFHERQPALNDFPSVLREGKNATYAARYKRKIPAMEADLAPETFLQFKSAQRPEGLERRLLFYVETSHMFVKSLADVIMGRFYDDPGYEITAIVLRRNLVEMLRSWLVLPRSPWIPTANPQHYTGGEYSTAHRNFALLPEVRPYAAQDTIDLSLGFFVDYELQADAFFRAYPRVRRLDVRSERLYEVKDEVQALYAALGMVPEPIAFDRLLRRSPINPHASSKRGFFITDEMPDEAAVDRVLLARVHGFLQEYRRAGIDLPPMPHLSRFVPCASLPSDGTAVRYPDPEPLPGYPARPRLCEVDEPVPSDDEIRHAYSVCVRGNNQSAIAAPRICQW